MTQAVAPSNAQPRWFSAAPVVLALGFLSGCTTVTPLQTASTVRPGAYRLSAQASATGWCGLDFPPGPQSCASIPSGVPLPELRLQARYGVSPSWDVGLGLHSTVVVPSGAQVGMAAEAKAVVLRLPGEDGAVHLFSVGPSLGYTHRARGLFGEVEGGDQSNVEVVAPLYYGYQTASAEWVVSPRFVERVSLHDLDRDGRREVLAYGLVGLQGGVVTRTEGPVRFAFGLEYLAPLGYVSEGAFTASVGILWELGGRE